VRSKEGKVYGACRILSTINASTFVRWHPQVSGDDTSRLHFLLLFSVRSRGQQSEAIFVGGQRIEIGMSKQEVTAKLGCRPLGVGDSSFIVSKQEPTDILGSIWFEGGRIKEVRRDVGYSGNSEVAHFTLELFRLLSGAAYSKPAVVTAQTVTYELPKFRFH
jgi:hypothetical protein